ncbi:MAG: HAD family hydrolase, partial [Archangium sp.]
MPLHFRATLFDLDGTLLDSLHDIGAAMNHALAAHRLPVHPLADYRRFVGEGTRVLVARAVPADRADLLEPVTASYRDYYAAHMLDH